MKYKLNLQTKILIVAIAMIIIILYIFNDSLTNILSNFLNQYGYIAFTISAGILEGIPQLLSTDILLVMGAIFNMSTIYTLLYVALGATVGSIIAFYAGNIFGKKLALFFVSEQQYDQITSYIQSKGKFALPLISVLPLPYFPIVFGAAKVSIFEFVFYGLMIRIAKHAAISYLIYYLIQHDYFDLIKSWFGL